jgi:tRNA(Arg) A34 adenosine deaminase TadA
MLLGLTGYMVLVLPEFIPRKGFAVTVDTEPIVQLPGTGDKFFIDRAFEMRRQAVSIGDQGYGAILVRDNIIVGQAPSKVIVNRDPTAHAEMQAIRDTASRLGSRDLRGCTLYSSSRACPMCEAAAFWAGIDRMVYGQEVLDAGRPSLCQQS